MFFKNNFIILVPSNRYYPLQVLYLDMTYLKWTDYTIKKSPK